MYFIIEKGCELFDKLSELQVKCDAAKEKINEFVKEVCGDGFSSDRNNIVNCAAISFPEKPELWKKLDYKWYAPTVKNKKYCKRFNELPRIPNEELNVLVGFKWGVTPSLHIMERPAVLFANTYVLINSLDGNIHPAEGMVEIVHSRYRELAEATGRE